MTEDTCVTVRFDFLDKEKFIAAFGDKVMVASKTESPHFPGAAITAVCMGDAFSYESYSDYLYDYIEKEFSPDEHPPLTHAEWTVNGQPAFHDEKKFYTYLGE
jgi:hypothetical protein